MPGERDAFFMAGPLTLHDLAKARGDEFELRNVGLHAGALFGDRQHAPSPCTIWKWDQAGGGRRWRKNAPADQLMVRIEIERDDNRLAGREGGMPGAEIGEAERAARRHGGRPRPGRDLQRQ